MVTFKMSSRFYGRHSGGKYPLDVTEIRAAFAASEALPERLRAFRAERLGCILADETPVPLAASAKIVLHLVPTSAVTQASLPALDVREVPIAELPPLSGGVHEHRYNFDGRLTYAHSARVEGVADSYAQIFRAGAIEAVDSFVLRGSTPQALFIPAGYEQAVITAVSQYIRLLDACLGIEPPIYVMLSLLGVRGRSIRYDYAHPTHAIDRDDLIVPELLLDDIATPTTTLLRPAFDAVSQACGCPGSRYYDEDGTWVGPR